ncbi:MAG TPA: type II CAAX endopeptidase family protein [Phycisphaerae bacterium]|jgi:membrane protease YdiL (CAAX protease family)
MMNDPNAPGSPFFAGERWPPAAEQHVPLARPVSVFDLPPQRDIHPMLLLDERRRDCLVDIGILLAFFAGLFLLNWLTAHALLWLHEGFTALPDVPRADDDTNLTPEQVRFAFLLTLVIGLVTVGVVTLIAKARGQRLAALGLSTRALGWNLLLGAAATVLSFVAMWTGALFIVLLVPGGMELLQKNGDRLSEEIPPLGTVGMAIAFLCVGFYEEVAFRGFLMPRLRRATGSWMVAVIISSALFAVAHMSSQVWVAVIPLFLVGLNLAIFAAIRRSLVPSIIGHWLFDLINVLVLQHYLKSLGPVGM